MPALKRYPGIDLREKRDELFPLGYRYERNSIFYTFRLKVYEDVPWDTAGYASRMSVNRKSFLYRSADFRFSGEASKDKSIITNNPKFLFETF